MADNLCALETHRQRSFLTHQQANARSSHPLPRIDLWPCLTCSWKREVSYVDFPRSQTSRGRLRRQRTPWRSCISVPTTTRSITDPPTTQLPSKEQPQVKRESEGRAVLLQRQHTFLPLNVLINSRLRVQAAHYVPFSAVSNMHDPTDRQMLLRLNLTNATRGELAIRQASARNRQKMLNSRQIVDLEECFSRR